MTGSSTATVHGARRHARAQEDNGSDSQPTVPASTATDLPPGVAPEQVLWDETLAADAYSTKVVPRGTRVRFCDLEGGTNAGLVLHHARGPAERLNVADTMKLQWNAYPSTGTLLLSDMGRVLATVMAADGAIDLLCGTSPGHGRPRLLLGLAKNGLDRRDLPPAANLFTPVRVDREGDLHLDGSPSGGVGDEVVLRAELDLLVTVAVTTHPLARADAAPGPLRVTAWSGTPTGPDDPARRTGPEARRAFENTDDLLATSYGSAL